MILADLSSTGLRRAAEALARIDEDWARHIEAVGPCRLEPKPAREPYEALDRRFLAFLQDHGHLVSMAIDEVKEFGRKNRKAMRRWLA
jgi:hypothetical protein